MPMNILDHFMDKGKDKKEIKHKDKDKIMQVKPDEQIPI